MNQWISWDKVITSAPRTPNRLLYQLSILFLCSLFSSRVVCGQPPAAAASSMEVHGVVVNSVTGKPIARALVFSGDQRYAMLTDQEGRFTFRLPEAAEARSAVRGADFYGAAPPVSFLSLAGGSFMARKPGYLDISSSPRTVPSDLAGGEVTIPLVPEAIVSGRVSLSTTDPPAGVNIQLLHKEIQDGKAHWRAAGAATTNSKGEFRMAELAAGDYKLMTKEWVDHDPVADAPHQQHYGYPPIYYPNAANFASSGILNVAAGDTVQADFSLIRQAYYPVRIELANANRGMGLGVTVNAGVEAEQGPGGFDLGYNYRDQRVDGELPNGTYMVEATGYLPGGGGSSGTVTVTVADAPATGARLTLVPNQSISVVIKDERSEGSDGTINRSGDNIAVGGVPPEKPRIANVYLVREGDQAGGGGLRPPRGPDDDSLVIENVAAGRYTVHADAFNGYIASITSGVTDLMHEPLIVGGTGVAAPIEVTVRNDYGGLEMTVQGDTIKDANLGSPVSPESAYVYIISLAGGGGRYDEMVGPIGSKMSRPNFAPGSYRVLAFDHQQQLEYQNPEALRTYENLGTIVTLAAGQTQHLELRVISTGKQ